MPEKISILKESGETLSSNVVSVFMIPNTEKKYIITTENAVDPHGLTVLHVSEIVDGTLQKISTDEEWSSIKTIMRAMISGNVGSYQYLPTIENINAGGQYSRDISVSASASKQMIDNYNAADKSVVAMPPVAPVSETQSVVSQPAVQPSSIFPTAPATSVGGDELIPGISEVPVGVPVPQPEGGVGVNGIQQNPQSVVTSMNVNQPVVGPEMTLGQGVVAQSQVNMGVTQQVPIVGAAPVAVQPMVGGSVVPQVANPEVANMNVGIQSPMVENPVGVASLAPQAPVVPDVQVAGPTQVVPTGQIAQEAIMPVNDLNNVTSATPSFDPNATLDEVVAGAQEMFMEGVKNLVQTIQEKVYRDLYNREMALKAREDAVLQKEQMLNGQPAGMAQPQVVNQPVVQTVQPSAVPVQNMVSQAQPVAPMGQVVAPMPVGPTVVSASNDVI